MATTFDYTREQLQLTEDLIVRVAGDAGWFARSAREAYTSARQALYRARGSVGADRLGAMLSFAAHRHNARALRRLARENEQQARAFIRSLSERW